MNGLGIICSIAFLMTASVVMAADLKVTAGGKDVTIKSTTINHEITIKDKDKGSQNSALECSYLYYSILSKGDIKKASELSLDPSKTAAKMSQYSERIGADEFKKTMAEYFTSGNIVLAELTLGEEIMLIVKTKEYTAGQTYRKKDGKYFISEMPFSDSAKALGKTLNMIQEGKLKL